MVMSQYSLDTTLKTYCDQERHVKDFSVAENKFRASLSPVANVSSQTVTSKGFNNQSPRFGGHPLREKKKACDLQREE